MIDLLLQLARENYNTLVVLAGVSPLGASCGIIGAFAVLRKRALTGDALSHAALPGLCVAFLIVRERQLTALLIGAFASGVAGIAIISALGRWTRVREDAAIGIVLSVFFGLGIVLLKIIQNLQGIGSKAGLNSYIFGKTAGMMRDDVYVILAASLVCLALIVLLYKEFQLVSFDGDFARSLGWPAFQLDLLLMSLVAAAVVIGLPNVGVVLVSALLIMPGAAARFWTDRLGTLLMLAGVFGFATGLVGTVLSASFNQLPAGPIIVLTGAALFLFSLMFGIRRGAIARLLQHLRFQREWRDRQILRALYDSLGDGSRSAQAFSAHDLSASRSWSADEIDRQLSVANAKGWITAASAGTWRLTDLGRQTAVEVVRGQRLWEAFLAEYPEQAGSIANLASANVSDIAPAATIAELIRKLRDSGRWPQAEAAA